MHDRNGDPQQFGHLGDLVMGAIAGEGALGVQHAAQVLYEAGGQRLLNPGLQAGVQRFFTRGALNTVTVLAPTLLMEGVGAAATVRPGLRALTVATGAAAAQTARAAGAQVLRGALRAGAVGLVIDGAFGAISGLWAYRRGTMTGRELCVHTATEAGTGAVSTATGVALAAGVIALTGGLAAPTVLAIGAGGALATRLGLTRLLRRRSAAGALVAGTAPGSGT